MKDPHEPVRWDSSESDASDELRSALAALADSERPQADELQRVRERLLKVFEAPPPRRVRLVHALGGSMGVLAIGVALVAGFAAWLRFERNALESMPLSAAGHAAQELARPSAPGEVNVAELARSGPEAHAVEASNAAVGGETSAREVSARGLEREDGANARAANRVRARGDRGASVRGREVATARSRVSAVGSDNAEHASAATVARAPRVSEVSVTPSVDDPVERAAAAVRPSESSARVAVREVPAEGPRQPAADGGQAVLLDEATLLQRARRLSSSDPAQALRVLDEHKRRFPAGMLSPEREVLAIELLRSLSRTQEAERRAREFRRDYPKSVYLSRIQP